MKKKGSKVEDFEEEKVLQISIKTKTTKKKEAKLPREKENRKEEAKREMIKNKQKK